MLHTSMWSTLRELLTVRPEYGYHIYCVSVVQAGAISVSSAHCSDNEDEEHLSDHVYDALDLASSVFRLFADVKRKLVGKNGIYTLDTGIWCNGEWGSGSD